MKTMRQSKLTASGAFDGMHRRAADKNAAMVFAGGARHEPHGKIAQVHSETPLPTRTIPANAPKLIGETFGRFTVIGLHRTIAGAWVVRCSFGNYETRRAKSIRNPNNFGDRCAKCRFVAYERKNYEFQMTGRELDWRTL